MFSGIIEYAGTVAAVSSWGRGCRLAIEAGHLAEGARLGDSMAVNGVCLTVLAVRDSTLELEAVAETLTKTNLGGLIRGSRVNLERPLPAEGRFHGHLVLGHVDSTTRITAIRKLPESVLMDFELDSGLRPYIVPRGSVAVDGTSLTVARLEDGFFTCSLIGYTLECTTLGSAEPGRVVNIETDIIGKYVVNLLERGGPAGGLNEEKLRGWGY